MKTYIPTGCFFLVLLVCSVKGNPEDLKTITHSLTSVIQYKKSENDPSKVIVSLVVNNSGNLPVGLGLPQFPEGLVFSPPDLDPLSTAGIPQEKMADGKFIPVIIAPHSDIKKEGSITIPRELMGVSPSQTFKLMTLAWFVDKDQKPLNGKIKSFFLVGSVKSDP